MTAPRLPDCRGAVVRGSSWLPQSGSLFLCAAVYGAPIGGEALAFRKQLLCNSQFSEQGGFFLNRIWKRCGRYIFVNLAKYLRFLCAT